MYCNMTDRRHAIFERKKKKIFDFITDFLQTHSEEELSISSLCKETKISRNTFYNHYSSLDELFNDYLTFCEKDLLEKLKRANDSLSAFQKYYQNKKQHIACKRLKSNERFSFHKDEISLILSFYNINVENLDPFLLRFLMGGMRQIDDYIVYKNFTIPLETIIQKFEQILKDFHLL